MKPMLAFRFADKRRHLTLPCHVQPKLDGVRMLYCDGVMQSRDEKIWHPSMFVDLRQDLSFVNSRIVLDGEFYVHGWSLQQINSAASVNRVGPSAKTRYVQYHVFDCVFLDQPDMSFESRWAAITAIMLPYSALTYSMVPTIKIYDHVIADGIFAQFKQAGYEGMMYRDSNAPYGLEENCGNQENRWNSLLKRKDFLDDLFEIVDVEVGEGKYSTCVGSLVLRMPNGIRFSAGSGLSDAQRHRYMDNPPIGLQAKINYERLSDDGIPLKPTVALVLEEGEP